MENYVQIKLKHGTNGFFGRQERVVAFYDYNYDLRMLFLKNEDSKYLTVCTIGDNDIEEAFLLNTDPRNGDPVFMLDYQRKSYLEINEAIRDDSRATFRPRFLSRKEEKVADLLVGYKEAFYDEPTKSLNIVGKYYYIYF